MVKLVFPYHDDFYLDISDSRDWLLVNGLGCPSPDEDDIIEVLGIIVRSHSGIKLVNFITEEIHD